MAVVIIPVSGLLGLPVSAGLRLRRPRLSGRPVFRLILLLFGILVFRLLLAVRLSGPLISARMLVGGTLVGFWLVGLGPFRPFRLSFLVPAHSAAALTGRTGLPLLLLRFSLRLHRLNRGFFNNLLGAVAEANGLQHRRLLLLGLALAVSGDGGQVRRDGGIVFLGLAVSQNGDVLIGEHIYGVIFLSFVK